MRSSVPASSLVGLGALVLTLVPWAPVTAQTTGATSTIAAIGQSAAGAHVQLEGAALYQLDEARFVFGDGTGTIVVDLDGAAAGKELPLFELVTVEGTVRIEPDLAASAGVGVTVDAWEVVRIVRPAVVVPEEQVVAAFQGWIVAFGGQAPTPDASTAPAE
jgi:uncharacterized protein YdeI (BOF family)